MQCILCIIIAFIQTTIKSISNQVILNKKKILNVIILIFISSIVCTESCIIFSYCFAFYNLYITGNLFLTQECEPPVSSVEGTIIAYEDLDNAFSILIQEEEDKYTTFEVEKCQMILALDCKEEELVSNLKIRMPLTCSCMVKNGNVEEISLQ